MALPALPLAPIAARLVWIGGAVAVGAILAARRGPERVDIQTEDALDRLHDGTDLRVDPANGRVDAEARTVRTFRAGRGGPGVAIDFAGLARLRVRRVPPAR